MPVSESVLEKSKIYCMLGDILINITNEEAILFVRGK